MKFSNGKFIFEADGTVHINIPSSEMVTVLINGEQSVGKIEVSSTDSIEIIYQNNIVEETKVTYQFSENIQKTEVSLEKKITLGKHHIFKDVDTFSSELTLELSLQPLFPNPTSYDDLEKLILQKGYNAIFIEENIIAVGNSPVDTKEIIVKSKPPSPGKPARFELINNLEDGNIINENQFFAEFVNEEPGISGCDIFGREIPAEDVFFFPDFGGNVLVEDRGLMSLKKGRLVFNRNSVNIIEENNVDRTINFEDGLVIYEGDYIIHGDIKDGAQVKCTGNLTVKGGVFDSYLFVDGNLAIEGNADQSVVYAGFSKIAARQIETFSLQYLEIFERVMFESSFYADDGFNYSEKTKSLELAKSEFLAIHQTIEPFISLVYQFSNERTIQLYNDFEKIIKDSTDTVLNDQSSSEDIRQEMEKLYEIIKSSKEFLLDELGTITLPSCNNSHIFSYKGASLIGSGAFQSIIESNCSIIIKGKAIATSLKAEKSLELNEITSGNENDIKLSVKKRDGHISAKLIDSDIMIELGTKKTVIDDELCNIYITYTEFPK